VKKLDRRVKYTLGALKEALIALLKKEHISKISVISICRTADVNRSTFYTHFHDQYDLLQYITREALDNIQAYLVKVNVSSGDDFPMSTFKQILEYVQDNADLFRALLSDNCDPDIQRQIIRMTKIVSTHSYEGCNERTKDYLMLFQINGCISILHKWLRDDMPETPETMAALLLKALGKI
jgi:AcrR family transcriptional regulator